MLNPRKAIQKLPTYHPPLGGRQGLRLDFNENPVGCSPRVLAKLRSIGADDLARYPQREPVEAAVAAHLDLDPAEVLLTNGVDEAIHLLCETYLEPSDEALIVVPTFAMYEIFAAATGASIVKVPMDAEFVFPPTKMLDRISSKTRLIAVANPNNPTGTIAASADLLALARFAPAAAVLVDEAYFEFCGQTLLRAWREMPNLYVARTFSKAYGLAGLRVGVLTGHTDALSAVRRAASPYSVNNVALTCVPEALRDDAYVQAYVAEVREGRDLLQRQLADWGIRFWPSQANFVLLHIGAQHKEFVSIMRELGILVRDRSSDPGCVGCVRITLGSMEHTSLLFRALDTTLSELGLITQGLTR